MTREEAIKVLNMVEAYGLADEAKRVAIEALKQKPRKGEWIATEYSSNEFGFRKWIEIECPFCGERPTYENLNNMNYCPNCGAKMDG